MMTKCTLANEGLISAKSVRFPSLGSQEDGEVFEYILLHVESDSVEIAIPGWLVNRAYLSLHEKVDLYIADLVATEPLMPRDNQGAVIALKHNEEYKGFQYVVKFSSPLNNQLNQELENSTLICMVQMLVKDCILLKQGIEVYLNHLIPYFSRIVEFKKKEYENLRKVFLKDIQNHVMENKKKLESLYVLLQQKNFEDMPVYFDLEAFREMIESEIFLTMIHITLFKGFSDGCWTGNLKKIENQQPFGYMLYLLAIKNLEKRLYLNYNHIVMIFQKSVVI